MTDQSTPTQAAAPRTMRTFMTIWIGQVVSLVGSSLTGFALGVWLYDQTGDALPLGITFALSTLPRVFILPFAGSLADRWNRRWQMLLSDTGAALTTVAVIVLLSTGELAVWHVYLLATAASVFSGLQMPAYQAAVATLVPKDKLGQANGLIRMADAISSLMGPALAGFIYVAGGLRLVMLIDFITYFAALGTLLAVHIPQPEIEAHEDGEDRSVMKDAVYGFRFILARNGLLAMLIYFALVNFLMNGSALMLNPLILSFAEADSLGVAQAVGGAGMLVGSIIMSAWGGTKKRMISVYGGIFMAGLGLILTGFQPVVWLVAAGYFLFLLPIPIGGGASQAIWQSKVPLASQGRVFAARSMIGQFLIPVSFLVTSLLNDRVFQPLMAVERTGVAGWLGSIIGFGPGRGAALIYVTAGVLLLIATVLAYSYTPMRDVEQLLPDAIPDDVDALPTTEAADGAELATAPSAS